MKTRKRGNGSIFQQSGCKTWMIQYYSNGKRIRESSGKTDHQQAQVILRDKINARDKGEVPELIRKVKVSELYEPLARDYRINQRKSLDAIERRWKLHLEGFFGNLLAGHVTTDVIERYVDSRLAAKAAVATVNRELACLKTMFRMACRKRTICRVPMFPSMMKENNARRGFIEHGHFKKLTEHASELWLRTFLEVANTYGWRKQEILQLQVKQVDLGLRLIRLDPGTTKNGEGREVVMTGRIFCLLQEAIRDKQPADYVFTRTNGSPVKSFRVAWKKLCAKAGVEGLLVHDFRRSAARNLRRAGVAESVIMETGGWKTPTMFRRYAIVSNADQRSAMVKLERFQTEFSHDFGHDLPTKPESETQIATGKLN